MSSALERSLNRQISLAAMANQMAAGIGRDKLIELTTKLTQFRTGVVAGRLSFPRILGDQPQGDSAQPDHARVPLGVLQEICFRGWPTVSRTLIGAGTCSRPSGSGIPPSRRWP